ncbi:Alpha/Beta hydrolase protein [Mycena floridula]|nr:Alpha/Beta hydrolase protein [Mycena floridula]
MLRLLPASLNALLVAFLWSKPNLETDVNPSLARSFDFQLRHIHAVSEENRVVFSDIASGSLQGAESYRVLTRPVTTHQTSSFAAFSAARRTRHGLSTSSSKALTWTGVEVPGPDITSRETLLTLAKMTSNAYYGTQDKDWYDLGPDWNNSYPYGWEPDEDGFRGQVFVSTDQSTVVLSIKGTTAPWIAGGGGPTTRKDKINDNLLFSCCCAKVGPTWSTVCGCHQGGWKCDLGCLEESLVEDSLFYGVGTNLYHNISYMYPESNIWIIGHSLGGALASLLGATFGAPVVAFEAPAERMAARRLHLPSPPSLDHITHVFNTADPIPMGQCTGVTSVCAIGGYALESQCHLGKIIRYDTVGLLGWSSAIGNHLIKTVIEKLLAEDWDKMVAKKVKKGKPHPLVRAVPEAVDEDVDCQDCFKWEIADFRGPAKVEASC